MEEDVVLKHAKHTKDWKIEICAAAGIFLPSYFFFPTTMKFSATLFPASGEEKKSTLCQWKKGPVRAPPPLLQVAATTTQEREREREKRNLWQNW